MNPRVFGCEVLNIMEVVFICFSTKYFITKLLTRTSKRIDLSVIHSIPLIRFTAVASFSESTSTNQNIRKKQYAQIKWNAQSHFNLYCCE